MQKATASRGPWGPANMAERFEMKVDRSGECHRWTGATTPEGYGRFSVGNRSRPAHRVALELVGVEIPAGMTVDHVHARGCQFRDCVRVDHLEVVTNVENRRKPGGYGKRQSLTHEGVKA